MTFDQWYSNDMHVRTVVPFYHTYYAIHDKAYMCYHTLAVVVKKYDFCTNIYSIPSPSTIRQSLVGIGLSSQGNCT